MSYISIYTNNPTAGDTNGSKVSTGDNSLPVTIGPLDAALNEESDILTLALRCDDGYKTDGPTTITPQGDAAAQWAVSLDGEVLASTITTESEILQSNILFYVKAKAVDTEMPRNDLSVKLRVETKIAAI